MRTEDQAATAFTLIELMVVIAVIAILASLLLPALGRARMAADRAVCINNEHEMGLALRLYLDEFAAYPMETVTNRRNTQNNWIADLGPYLKSEWPANNYAGHGVFESVTGVLACPSYNRLPGWYLREGSLDNPLLSAGAYAYNNYGTARVFTWGSPPESPRGLAFDGPPGKDYATDDAPGYPLDYGTLICPVQETQVISPSEMIAIADSQLTSLSMLLGGQVPYDMAPPCFRITEATAHRTTSGMGDVTIFFSPMVMSRTLGWRKFPPATGIATTGLSLANECVYRW